LKLKSTFTIFLTFIGIALFVLAIIVPNFIREPVTSQQNACINNLRRIDAAKQQWALDNHKTNGAVSWNDILPYLTELQDDGGRKVGIPHCPSGGTYTLGNIGEPPRCSVEGHVLPP
jgi:general secretion pathway protein G